MHESADPAWLGQGVRGFWAYIVFFCSLFNFPEIHIPSLFHIPYFHIPFLFLIPYSLFHIPISLFPPLPLPIGPAQPATGSARVRRTFQNVAVAVEKVHNPD